MISTLLLTAIASYNCEVAAPQSVRLTHNSATASVIGLPPAMQKRKFSITIDGDPLEATLNWPGDPMNISGRFPAVSVGGRSYAFPTFSGGPCLFTETSCLSQVTLVDSSDMTANVVIVPSAITFSDVSRKNRAPFIVIIQGTCARSGAKK